MVPQQPSQQPNWRQPSAPTPAPGTPSQPAPGAGGPGGPAEYQQAQQLIGQLTDLRSQLESGQIDVATFVSKGQPMATQVNDLADKLTSQGQRTANQYGNPLFGQLHDTGFTTWQTDPSIVRGSKDRVQIDLPQKYQAQIRESLLPANVTGDERKALIDSIPDDIDINSDQYKIEKEAIREKYQSDSANKTAADTRAGNLTKLSGLLATQADQAYSANSPAILEDLNARGLLGSSGVGQALAREKSRQAQITEGKIAEQSLSDSNVDVNAGLATAAQTRALQQSGLSTSLGEKQNQQAFQQALTLARLTQPQGGGKTGNQTAANAIGATGAAASVIAAL